MALDLQARSQYLSLALFAQKVVSALMEYVDENQSENMKAAVREALLSLRGLEDLTSLTQKRAAAFTSYEHLRTLEQVWSTQERAEAIAKLEQLISGTPESQEKKEQAARLIELFGRLQNQALWNFEQPKPVSPQVVQQLCQTT